jgi:hypothetical protein
MPMTVCAKQGRRIVISARIVVRLKQDVVLDRRSPTERLVIEGLDQQRSWY